MRKIKILTLIFSVSLLFFAFLFSFMDHSHAVRSPFVDKYNSTNGDDQERLAETLKRFSHHGESFVRAKLKQGGVALPASPVKSVRRSDRKSVV